MHNNNNMRINIIYPNNGVGLTKDFLILNDILNKKGNEVNPIDLNAKKNNTIRADANIFLEHVESRYFNLAKTNYLFPNPEWFEIEWKNRLSGIDYILCKSHDTEKIFTKLGKQCIYTSFTSDDCYDKTIKKERVFLHLAGQSSAKGTRAIFDTWEKRNINSNLILQKLENFAEYIKHDNKNILNCFARLSHDDKLILLNSCLFILCTSEYEGFGHYIWEALSVGAVVISTNHEPMNEYLNNENSILINPCSYSMQRMGRMGHITYRDLYPAIEQVLNMSNNDIQRISDNARQTFLDNDKKFKEKINEIF